MEIYAGIDLHSNNSVLSVLDESERTVYAKRLPNDLGAIMAALRSCAGTLRGVAVEFIFNWYWLVDGLQDAGYTVHMVNTAAVRQYDGLKYRGDFEDARHLAQLLRLGILTPDSTDSTDSKLAPACRLRPPHAGQTRTWRDRHRDRQ